MGILVNTAYAADVADTAQAAQNSSSMLFVMVIFFVAVYFMIIRPQNKKQKEQDQMLTGLAVGDEVVTTGGIVGKIAKISGSYVVLAINDDVEVKLQKNAIVSALPKGMIKEIS